MRRMSVAVVHEYGQWYNYLMQTAAMEILNKWRKKINVEIYYVWESIHSFVPRCVAGNWQRRETRYETLVRERGGAILRTEIEASPTLHPTHKEAY